MANTPARVAITKDFVSDVVRGITDLVGKQVLVGIPESKAERGEGDPINNATIGYLMETGSPANNVPARPHLVPGVQRKEREEVDQLQKAAAAALENDAAKVDRYLYNAGAIGMLSVRDLIQSNIPPPLSPSTIRGRKYARKTKTRRESEEVYLKLLRHGVDPAAAQAETDIIALVNTGKYRNSITYVVRKRGQE